MPSRARRFLRIAALLLAVAVLLIAAALVALRRAYPPERLATMLAAHVSAATGRTLGIGGGLDFRLWPNIAIEADDISLANADWAASPQMVHAGHVAFELSLSDLLRRELRILSVEVKGLELELESDGSGRFNWQLAHEKVAPAPSSGGSSLQALDHVVIADARVRYRSAKGGDSRQLNIDTFSLATQGDGNAVNAAIKLGRQLWKIEGRTGPITGLLGGTNAWPIALQFSTEGASLSAEGALGHDERADTFQGKVSLRVTSGAALPPFASAAARLPMPAEANATLSLAPRQLQAESMTVSLAGQKFTGRVSVQAEPAPLHLEADLAATTIDLARLRAGAASAPAPSTAPKARAPLFGDDPLPFDDVPSIDAKLALRIDRLDVPDMPPVSMLELRLSSTAGVLSLAPLDFSFASGQVRTRIKLARRTGQALRVDAQVEARSLSVETLDAMWRSTGKHFNGGRANLDLDLAMAGRTPAQLAASATGNALLTTSGVGLTGKAAALDQDILARLLDALLPKSMPRENLVLQCVVARLPLRNGVAKIDRSVAMETAQLAVSASGEVDLARQRIGLAFQPQAKKGLDIKAANLVELLLLTGPLQAPELSINPLGAAKQAADLGIAAATGGWSLLAPAIRTWRGASVCEFASSGGSGSKAAASGKGQQRPFRPIRNLLGR